MDLDTGDDDDSDEVDNPEVTLPIHGLKNIKALTYDPVEQHIYWVEGRQKIIKRAHDNGTSVSSLLEICFCLYEYAMVKDVQDVNSDCENKEEGDDNDTDNSI